MICTIAHLQGGLFEMAKRRKKRQSPKCPEPFNTMLDLAGAAAIDYIHYKRRQKNRGRLPKIDPYAAAGIAMGMGKINSTEDVIALGGILGAVGAFDKDSNYQPIDNRYAWRLNCEDGSSYHDRRSRRIRQKHLPRFQIERWRKPVLQCPG